LSEEAKPARKIKPPSASFLKSKEGLPSAEGMPAAPQDSSEGLLGAPSLEDTSDQDLFAVPDTSGFGDAAPPPTTTPSAGTAAKEIAPEGPRTESTVGERLAAELRELRDIVNAVESLNYLRTRVGRAIDEGADALTLVSFYRLVVRSLSEATEQARRDHDIQRSKASKLELELATALANGAVSEAAAPKTGISNEALDKIAKLEQEIAQANEQRERLLFDFKNMRERTQKDLDIRLFKDKEKFFKNFLPVLDSFERAQQSLNEQSSVQSLLEGFRLINTQFLEGLMAEGLEAVDTSGEFDPRFHEAVGEVENNQKPDHAIFDELSRGYKLGERLIRPAMVRISRNPSGVIAPPQTDSAG
jgi:molecular chaperone GrpE